MGAWRRALEAWEEMVTSETWWAVHLPEDCAAISRETWMRLCATVRTALAGPDPEADGLALALAVVAWHDAAARRVLTEVDLFDRDDAHSLVARRAALTELTRLREDANRLAVTYLAAHGGDDVAPSS